MQTQPHIHAVRITRDYPGLEHGGAWYIEYGDIRVKFARFFHNVDQWTEKRKRRVIGRAAKKAILRHDQGSIRTMQHETILEIAASFTPNDRTRWGMEQL